jgi:hypothetical protein
MILNFQCRAETAIWSGVVTPPPPTGDIEGSDGAGFFEGSDGAGAIEGSD